MCFSMNSNPTSQKLGTPCTVPFSSPQTLKVGVVFRTEAKPYLASHWSAALSITAAALAFLLNHVAMVLQARLNLRQPRWTADSPAVDKNSQHGQDFSSHPEKKGKSLKRKGQTSSLFVFLCAFLTWTCWQTFYLPLSLHQRCCRQVFFFSPSLTSWRLRFSVICLTSPHRSLHHGWVFTCNIHHTAWNSCTVKIYTYIIFYVSARGHEHEYRDKGPNFCKAINKVNKWRQIQGHDGGGKNANNNNKKN